MGRFLIATPTSDSDRYLITAGSEAATMEAANLKLQQPGDWWRAVDPSMAYLIIEQKPDPDTGLLDPWNLIWPGYAMTPRPNDPDETLIVPASTDTWRVRAANTIADLTTNPAVDISRNYWLADDMHKWPWAHSLLYTDNQLHTYPFTRIDFTTSRAWWQIGRLYMAKAYKPKHDIRVGWSLKYIHNITREETQAGNIYPMPGPGKRRGLRYSLQFESEDDMMDNAFEIDRDRGGNGDVLVIRDWESRHIHRWMLNGLFSDLGEIVNGRAAIYEHNYGVEELPL
jgi:hypothetical protein